MSRVAIENMYSIDTNIHWPWTIMIILMYNSWLSALMYTLISSEAQLSMSQKLSYLYNLTK